MYACMHACMHVYIYKYGIENVKFTLKYIEKIGAKNF